MGGVGKDERPGAGGWDTVLPPVGGGTPRVQDRGAAGVDEATAFLSQWGPPPLRPTGESDEVPPGWARPAPPSRAGAGRTADNPAAPPRPGPDWSRPGGPPAALPPVADAPEPTADPQLPSAPTEPAAERWIAERLAAGRSASASAEPAEDRFAGYWTADRPAKDASGRSATDEPGSTGRTVGRAPGRPDPGETTARPTQATDDARPAGARAQAGRADAPGTRPRAERAGTDAISSRAADRPGTDERFAGYWATERPGGEERPGAAGRAPAAENGEDRFAGYWVRDTGERAGEQQRERDSETRDEPTEVLGPFDVGAWSRDAAVAPSRPRGRQRSAEPPEPVTEKPKDRAAAGSGSGGGGGAEPPKRGGSPQRPRRTFGDPIRTFVRGIGQTFITLGLVLLLLAAYEVWFTDLVNHRTQKDLTTALQNQWDNGDDPTVGTAPARPGEKVRSIPLGEGFALIYIPDFGTDYVFTVVEGTGADQLNKGPGHYVDTPLPGEIGNVAIAGHRVGKGSPFLNLDKLKAGSAIVIRTKSFWYTYRVVGGPGGNADAVSVLGFPGREIVDPSDVGVIAPVPDKPGAKPTQRVLTLTTCHPKFTARQRMVIHAELEGTPFPVSQGVPPSMTGA